MPDLFSYAEAKAARDRGMAQAAARCPEFGARALAALERIARRQLHVHIDDLLCELGDDRPASPNAMGSVWTRAIRAGFIQRSNQIRPCTTDPLKRAHLYPVYFSLIFRPELGARDVAPAPASVTPPSTARGGDYCGKATP